MNTNWRRPDLPEDDDRMTDLEMSTGEIVFGCVCMAAIGGLLALTFYAAWAWSA